MFAIIFQLRTLTLENHMARFLALDRSSKRRWGTPGRRNGPEPKHGGSNGSTSAWAEGEGEVRACVTGFLSAYVLCASV